MATGSCHPVKGSRGELQTVGGTVMTCMFWVGTSCGLAGWEALETFPSGSTLSWVLPGGNFGDVKIEVK